MGETADRVLELGLHARAQLVTLLPTGRWDAVLHEPAPERPQNTIGRPGVTGRRLPALDQVLPDPETVGQELTGNWYGQGKRQLQICTGTALWDRSGDDPFSIRWVLTRDPAGKRPAQALVSPDPHQPAEEILQDVLKRWSLDVTVEERRAHLGIETQRQWSDLATRRSTPLLFGLSSLVTLFGRSLHPDGHIPVVQAAWYRKQTATFRDVLAVVRRHLWDQETFGTSRSHPKGVFVPRAPLERWSLAICSCVGNGQSQAQIETLFPLSIGPFDGQCVHVHTIALRFPHVWRLRQAASHCVCLCSSFQGKDALMVLQDTSTHERAMARCCYQMRAIGSLTWAIRAVCWLLHSTRRG